MKFTSFACGRLGYCSVLLLLSFCAADIQPIPGQLIPRGHVIELNDGNFDSQVNETSEWMLLAYVRSTLPSLLLDILGLQ
jgi:hypothetical protein